MAKASNLVGQRFGKLTVIERAPNNRKGNTMWKCQCDCRNTKIALGYDLTHGRTVSCGCNNVGKIAYNRKDITGQKYGRLTVIGLNEEKSRNGALYWDCLCDCGIKKTVNGYNLKNGNVRSCGCLGNENRHLRKGSITDKTGKRYHNYIVLGKYGEKNNEVLWKCLCDCGKEFIRENSKLSARKSCGCIGSGRKKDTTSDCYFFTTTKGMSQHSYDRLRKEWHSMKDRCKPQYHNSNIYYERGISVCEEWLIFRNFAIWALENGYDDDLTLDRIDNNKSYSPDNCRWATWKEQNNNKRDNVVIEYRGKSQTLKQWSEELNLNYGMLKARWQHGWKAPMLFET